MVESAQGELADVARWKRHVGLGLGLALVALGLLRRGRDRDRRADKGDVASIARREIARKHRWTGGSPATAQIVAYETVNRLASDPTVIRVYLELELTTPEGDLRTVITGEEVDEVYLTFLRPGALVPVRVARQDPSLIAIEWWLAAWWPAPSTAY